MSMQIGQFQETPGAPLVQIAPLLSMIRFETVVLAGLNTVVQSITGGHAVVGTEQIIGTTPVVWGAIYAARAAGGSLTIEASADGVAVWDVVYTLNLVGLNIPNIFGPLELPGWNFLFRVWNADIAFGQGFTGTFGCKAV